MKKTRFLLLISILLLLALTFVSCDQLTALLQPTDGLSAYEIAVKNGFDGTEEEWLLSLKGTDGKDGVDGVDGKDGIDGVDGKDGKDGQNGKDGESGVIEQPINQTVNNNDITISGDAIDVRYASGVALKSAVTIRTVFTDASSHAYGSAGAGVVYQLDNNGNAYILTNFHVVYDKNASTENKISDNITVYLYGMEFTEFAITATYIGGSMTYDIAVLKIEQSQEIKDAKNRGVLCAITTDHSLLVGEAVIAIGNPEGDGFSVTSGIINVLSEYVKLAAQDGSGEINTRVIRTDASVNGGNSGGGLFNAKGKLVGIVNAKIVKEGVENIGYAIPVDLACSVADNIIYFCDGVSNESVKKPLLGIEIERTDVTTEYNTQNGSIESIETIKVSKIDQSGLAYGALSLGDTIKSLTIGSKTLEVKHIWHVSEFLLNARPGDTLYITVDRLIFGEVTVQITIPSAKFAAQK